MLIASASRPSWGQPSEPRRGAPGADHPLSGPPCSGGRRAEAFPKDLITGQRRAAPGVWWRSVKPGEGGSVGLGGGQGWGFADSGLCPQAPALVPSAPCIARSAVWPRPRSSRAAAPRHPGPPQVSGLLSGVSRSLGTAGLVLGGIYVVPHVPREGLPVLILFPIPPPTGGWCPDLFLLSPALSS